MARETVSDDNDKPVFDEQTLARLLEAAYVLQEHNEGLQKLEQNKLELNLDLQNDQLRQREDASRVTPQVSDAATEQSETQSGASAETAQPDYTLILAQIVETQHQIQVRHLELENTMALVADRVTELARAAGSGIGILDGKIVRYRGAKGTLALPQGSEVPLEKALCVASLRTGQVIRCLDVNPEFLLDPEECRRRGIQSLIVVPIYHDGGIAGALELYFASTQAFTEQDVHTCQLMAGLITEALARDAEVVRKRPKADERAALLEALEKLKPSLVALAEGPVTTPSGSARSGAAAARAEEVFLCRKCGHELVGEEQFCGKCGTPRSRDYEPPSLQSKVASLWHMQQAIQKSEPVSGSAPGANLTVATDRGEAVHGKSEKPLTDAIEDRLPELFAPVQKTGDGEGSDTETIEPFPADEIEELIEQQSTTDLQGEQAETETPEAETALTKSPSGVTWSSAAAARDSLEQLASSQNRSSFARFWSARRGDIYLAVALILVLGVIRWAVWGKHSVTATATSTSAAATHRRQSPEADLPLFDRMLISLGLAEPPEAPESKGNPDTQVWVDLHTALYYCPGADLYGKTPKGKFTTQRDAQLDQFEPAYRKSCD